MKVAALAAAVVVAACAVPSLCSPVESIPDAAARIGQAGLLKKSAPTDVPNVRVAGDLEPWLAAGLESARKEKRPSDRARDLAALANSLRVGSLLEHKRAAWSPHDVGGKVKMILAEPAFAVARVETSKPQKQSWLALMLKRLADLWNKILGRAANSGAASAGIGDILAILAVAAATCALIYIVVRVAMLFAVRRARRSGDDRRGYKIETPVDADRCYEDARHAADAGSYGRAVTLLFQAALMALDRSGRVAYDPARTAGEYRRAVRRNVASAASPFDDLARAFTRVAYADDQATEGDWLSASASFTTFEPLAGARR